MKRFFLIAAAMLLMAGTASAQVSIGAGYARMIGSMAAGDETVSGGYNGAYGTLTFGIPIVKGFSIAPAVTFNYGTDSNPLIEIEGTEAMTVKTEIMDLSLPVDFVGTFDISKVVKFNIFAGPRFSYGLKSKTSVKVNGTLSEEVDWYSEKNVAGFWYNKFNLTLGGGIAFDIAHLRIKAAYYAGLLDLAPSTYINYKSSVFEAGIAYIF